MLAVAGGCTSSKPARVVEARPAAEQAPAASPATPGAAATPAADTKITTAVEIRSLELREGAPEVFVDLEASSPLVWTSFRNPEGRVVVELPNAVPVPRIQDLTPDDGLVSSVKVQRETEGSRPMTRLVIATRHEVEHSVTADGLHLQIRLLPLETTARVVASEPAKQKLAFEPVAPPPAAEATTAAAQPPAAVAARAPSASAPPAAAPSVAPAAPTSPATHADHAEAAVRQPARAGTPDEPAVAPPPAGTPATRLETIEVIAADPSAGGGAVIRIAGDGEFPYSTFALADPNRFVLDLQGVQNRSSRGTIAVDDSIVQRVRVAQFKPGAKGVARVVFDLKQGAVPHIERSAHGLLVSFGSGAATGQPLVSAATPPPAAPPAAASSATQDATAAPPAPRSRRKGSGSRGSSKSAAASAGVGESATPPPDRAPSATAGTAGSPAAPPSDLALRPAPPAAAPPAAATGSTQVAMARRPAGFDVEDAPPAPAAKGKAGSGLPRVAPGATSMQQSSADLGRRQSGQPSTSEKLGMDISPEQKTYTGEPIDLKVTNADVTEVLRTFAQISGLNIVVQPGVTGTVTAELENVPWDQAFEEVLKINNLGYEREGNVIRIAPTNVLRQEAQERQQLAQAKALVLPLRTIMRRLSYANASQVASLLKSGASGLLTQRGSVIVDERTNTLIIKELPDYLDAVLAVVSNLDTPEPQVMIEARIIETTKTFSRALGINWGFSGVADAAHGNTTGLVFPNNGTIDGRVGLSEPGTGTLGITLGNVLNTFKLDIALQAAEAEGLVNILSAPKVATLNNQQAYIQSGVQLPVQTIANNTVTVQYINATLRLEVTPQVTAEGTIVMDINISKKEPNTGLLIPNAASAPISTKDARTRLVVRDGGTAVIGGIYKVTTDSNEGRVPGLASLPIIGHLFRNKQRDQTNDELLIFITPRVIKI